MKKENKKLYIILIIFILMIIFFRYAPIITFDSSHYLWLENMLSPNDSFGNWDVGRGLIFPLIILCSNAIFGHNSCGILMLMFIFYITMLTFTYLIIKKANENVNILNTKNKKILLGILATILIIFNPIVFGYYHTLLTEFVAITFSVAICYFAWKWIDLDFGKSKIKYIIYTIMFAIITVFLWHLKQPYVTAVLFPVITASIISICRNFNWKNILQRIITLIVCVICLICSLKLWNILLEIGKVDTSKNTETIGFVTKGIVNGVSQLEEVSRKENTDLANIDNYKISNKDKEKIEKIIKGESEYKNFILYNNKNEKAKDIVIFLKNNQITTSNSIGFLTKTLFTTPTTVIKSYINNYLCTINVFNIEFEVADPKVTTDFTLFGTTEHRDIAFRIYDTELSNVFDTKYQLLADEYADEVEPIRIVNILMNTSKNIIVLITKIAFLILPIILLVVIILSIKNRKKMSNNIKNNLNIIIILLSYSLFHILSHSTLGAFIDRYTVPAMVTMFIAYILIFFQCKNKK